jgi:hypothetical protein
MLITLPGPGSDQPRGPIAIDVEVGDALASAHAAADGNGEAMPNPGVTMSPEASEDGKPEAAAPHPTDTSAAQPSEQTSDPLTTGATAPDDAADEESARARADATRSPEVARVEPPETLPPATPAVGGEAEETPAAPPAKLKGAEHPSTKKSASRPRHLAKVKPKAPAGKTEFRSLFSGTILAPYNGSQGQSAAR